MTVKCYGQKGKLFTADKELSSSMINSIYQDKEGIIWIATEDGLNRYDGAKFTVYKNNPGNENSLVNNYTRILFEDSKGRFFVGTLNGLQIYNRATGNFTTIPRIFDTKSSMGINVSTIIERRDGKILIGTSGHSLFSLETSGDDMIAKQTDNKAFGNHIHNIYEDKKGNLWVITEDRGIQCMDISGRLKSYLHEKDINRFSNICEDIDNNIYVGSLTKGLFRYDRKADKFIPIPYPDNPALPVKYLYPATPDEIYIGTDGNGMKVYNIHTKKIEDANLNITSLNLERAKVHSILKDRQNNIWLGLFQKGVVISPPQTNQFKYIGHKSPMHNLIGSCCIMSVFEDRNKTLWVGTDNDGLYAINPDGIRQAHFVPSGSSHSIPPTIMSLYEDSENNFWVGSYRNGIAKLDRKTSRCTYLPLPNSMNKPPQDIYCMVEDKYKQLWIGAMGAGLYITNLRTGEIKSCPMTQSGLDYTTQKNVLHNAWINCLLYSRDDKLYIGTYDGLGCLDIPTMNFVSTYGTNRLLDGLVIYALYEAPEGDIWIGTSQGLKHLNPQTREIREYTMEDGLPSNSISGIKAGPDGNLWISTNFGISHFNPGTCTFVNFYAGDGLQGNEFSKGAACKTSQGRIIFGGTNGITSFNPQEITSPNKKPEIRISDFYIHDKAVRVGMKSGRYDIVTTAVMEADRFHLSHKDNSFSIEFSAMEFYNPERISYVYSFNSDSWINLQPGTNRVSFSDLSPGTYHFQVKAQDYNSYSEVKDITILISPPWYTSWWAETLYFLIIGSIVIFIIAQIRHRYRVRQAMMEHLHAEQLNEAKLQFFINVSHEIRTPMSLIISPLQKLMATDPDKEHQRSYGTIYRNAQRILQLVNQLMDIRKIDKGQMQLKFQETDIVAFIQDLCYTFEYQATTKHVQFDFHPDMKELQAWIDPKNFDKIILNILSNAFKFTPEEGNIQVYLRTGEDAEAVPPELRRYFEITIRDSGIGIDEQEMGRIFDRFYQIRNSLNNSNVGTGIGLHLTRSLVELHHGTITVRNNDAPAPGCSFILRLPLGGAHLTPEEIEDKPAVVTPLHLTTALPYPVEATEEAADKTCTRTKRRLLVVEDDEEIRRYLCHELGADFHMQECPNGKEALALVLKNAPDLIISDIMMPGMDGITLCRKIKQNIHVNHIPIVLLTAKSREEDTLEGLSIGADAYIVKPFSIELLRQTVINLIKGRELLKNNFRGSQVQEKRVQKLEVESPDERLLNRVMKVINDNISNPDLNVEMIAESVGISRVHLHRKLKELTNQSTRDLIRNIRLKQAASLLASKRRNINEVATLTGFTNVAYFSTAFKELYGMTPTEYMEQNLSTDE